jgi:transketolase
MVAGSLCAQKSMGDHFVFAMMGMEDRFGESGKPRELLARFGLTAEHIATVAWTLVQRKSDARRTA